MTLQKLDAERLPKQEVGRVVKAEHVVIVLHVVLVEKRVELLQLRLQDGEKQETSLG